MSKARLFTWTWRAPARFSRSTRTKDTARSNTMLQAILTSRRRNWSSRRYDSFLEQQQLWRQKGSREVVELKVFPDKNSLARAAAGQAASTIRDSIRERGSARIIAATGASQFEFLDELTKARHIDWPRVEMFHLDEYLGMPATHPASFQKYLLERLITKTGIIRYHLLNGEDDPSKVINEASAEIRKAPIDVAFVGVGENGHLAFNDPPADFETEKAYIVVQLDEPSRRQQLGEGWFQTL